MSGSSLYDVLGVPKEASAKEIRKAYRKRSVELHPDKWAGAEDSVREQKTAEFQALTEAHEELKVEDRRKEYDRTGKTGAHPVPPCSALSLSLSHSAAFSAVLIQA